jgi:hypothetical protein
MYGIICYFVELYCLARIVPTSSNSSEEEQARGIELVSDPRVCTERLNPGTETPRLGASGSIPYEEASQKQFLPKYAMEFTALSSDNPMSSGAELRWV